MSKCTLCGEPMQPGEEMFKFHGSLGPCPKPPLPKPVTVVAEYIFRDADVDHWIDIKVNGVLANSIGPFPTADERQLALNDFLDMMRSTGAQDLPNYRQ
jgi:hypothetical protein